MGSSDILIMDLEPNSCSVDHCGQIGALLPKLVPESEIVIRTDINVPFETRTSFSPDLILLKSCLMENLHQEVQILKEEWKAISVLGIFCANSSAPAAVCQVMAEYLEDFLFCPFEELELLLRVQRLLQMTNQIDQLVNAARDQAGAPAAAIQTISGALLMQKDVTLKTLKFIGEVIDKV